MEGVCLKAEGRRQVKKEDLKGRKNKSEKERERERDRQTDRQRKRGGEGERDSHQHSGVPVKLGIWIRLKICLRPEGARDKQTLGQEGRGQAQDGYRGHAGWCWAVGEFSPCGF